MLSNEAGKRKERLEAALLLGCCFDAYRSAAAIFPPSTVVTSAVVRSASA